MNGRNSGITLIALIITIIVLLILAGISIGLLVGDNSILKKAQKSKEDYKMAEAREKLSLVLTDAEAEKRLNTKYNQDDFLDSFIKENLECKIKGDIVIVNGYAFELVRDVPKIGKYVGKEEDLVFPELIVSSKVAEDNKSATIMIEAREEQTGIKKIEIWLAGEKIDEFPYNNEKTVTKEYTVNRNGIYTVKAYADLMCSEKVTIEGIVPEVEFSPNGNTIYKKGHLTKIKVKGTEEIIKSLKYKWTDSVKAPAESEFTETCTNNSTITGKDFTGTYYLWILLETETGKTNICGSEGFNFDNEAPNITSFTTTKYSETGITLSATAQDTKSGISKFEFYVDNVLKDTQICEETPINATKSININDLSMGKHTCLVKVYDLNELNSDKEKEGITKVYTWNCYSVITNHNYSLGPWKLVEKDKAGYNASDADFRIGGSVSVVPTTGIISYTISKTINCREAKKGDFMYNGPWNGSNNPEKRSIDKWVVTKPCEKCTYGDAHR